MPAIYNPASLRVKEQTSGLDLTGVVALVFPDGSVTDLGRGVVGVNIASAVRASLIYAVSTAQADGTNTSFPFSTPIGTLILATAGSMIVDPAQASVVYGNLVLTFAPGDPGNPDAIKVGALYLP